MKHIIWLCLFFWIMGGGVFLSAISDQKISHIQYLSDSKIGKIISRILIASFGLVLFGIGIILWLAPA